MKNGCKNATTLIRWVVILASSAWVTASISESAKNIIGLVVVFLVTFAITLVALILIEGVIEYVWKKARGKLSD